MSNEQHLKKNNNSSSEVIDEKKTSRQIEYTTEQFTKMIEKGHIQKELGDQWLQDIEEKNKLARSIAEYRKKNPNATWDNIMKEFFQAKTTEITFCEIELNKIIFELLWKNKELLSQENLHDLPSKFFKSIGNDEFGVSRLIADPLNNVPKMLENFSKPDLIREEQGYNIYLIEAKHENSLGDTLRLNYRYRAQNDEDANNRSQAFIRRITGRQKKVFEACWAMANQKMRHTYSCSLTELMLLAYPARKDKSYFAVHEKVEFYQDLLDLTETRLTVEKKEKPGKKKRTVTSFILPFITIHKLTEDDLINSTKESERYPNQVSISVLHNPLYETEKLYSVGAGIKYQTLELPADDMQLAEWIQIRKSQAMKEKYITFTSREELIRLAKLDGIKHSGMANRKLLSKLDRLKEKGIIIDHPKKVSDRMRLKIR